MKPLSRKQLKNYFYRFMLVLMAIIATGCDKENDNIIGGDEIVGTVTFQSVGLTFTPSEEGEGMYATIPVSGCAFTIIPDEKYQDVGYVTRVWINGVLQEEKADLSGEPPYLESIPLLSGDWGEFENRIEDGRRVIDVRINANDTFSYRRIDFQLGDRLIYVWCTLIQPGLI